MTYPFDGSSENPCHKCGLPMTTEEIQENTNEEPRCRKCTAMQQRLQDFRDHLDDDNYFMPDGCAEVGPGGVPYWEWYAYRVICDFEDAPAMIEDLKQMEKDDLSTEDYRKIIWLLTEALLSFKYSQEAFELPR